MNKQEYWDETSLPVELSKPRDLNKRSLVDFSPPIPFKNFCSSDQSFEVDPGSTALRKSQQGLFRPPPPYHPNSQEGSNTMDYSLSNFSGMVRQVTPVDQKEANGINFDANPSTSAEATEFSPSAARAAHIGSAEEVSPRSSSLVFDDMPSMQQSQQHYSSADSNISNLPGLARIASECLRHVRMEHERNEHYRINMLREWRCFREVIDHRLLRANDLMQGMAASLHSLQRPLQQAAEYEQDWQPLGHNTRFPAGRGMLQTHSRRGIKRRGTRNRGRGQTGMAKSHYKTKE